MAQIFIVYYLVLSSIIYYREREISIALLTPFVVATVVSIGAAILIPFFAFAFGVAVVGGVCGVEYA